MTISEQIREIYKAINSLHGNLNVQAQHIDNHLNDRCDENNTGVEESQNATCELSEELDERITEVETALCDLSELIA